MHDAATAVDEALARVLLDEPFPELRGRELRALRSTGTVNSIIRVGDDLVARFPLLPVTAAELAAEAEAMAALAASCPFPAPLSYGVAAGSAAFPSAWSVQTWIPGGTAHFQEQSESLSLARDLATLIRALRAVDPAGRVFDGRGRGGDLTDHDEWVLECLERSRHLLDATRAHALWARLRMLPRAGADTMSHRDLTPFNLLVDDSLAEPRLAGVLDGGGFGPADRALDLVAAWHLFDAPARQVLRDGVGADDVEWSRGAAWALQQALGLGWYYETSNPEMSRLGLSTVRRLLDAPELAAPL